MLELTPDSYVLHETLTKNVKDSNGKTIKAPYESESFTFNEVVATFKGTI